MIIGLQIIAIIFALFMIYIAILHKRREELNKIEIISWITIWIVTIFIVIFPELLRSFAKNFLITRLFDLMIVGGFILVISMVSITYLGFKRIERKMEEYVRREALRNKNKSK